MSSRGQKKYAVSEVPVTRNPSSSPTYLEHAILHTLKYFNVLGMPLTTTQLWRFLLVPNPTAAQRWEGHSLPTLVEVQHALATSAWLADTIDRQWGYCVLKHQTHLIPAWLARHSIAQQKWKIVHKVIKTLAWIPGVKLLAMSGSMAMYNTKPSSDFDLLIVAEPGRIWTVRLLLLCLAQLLGRRRKHWDQAAPDKLCFNHYVTSRSLSIDPAIRNEYTATLYAHLIPLVGAATYRQFMAANAGWLKRLAMYRDPINAWTQHQYTPGRLARLVQRHLTLLLLEPIGEVVEYLAEAMQRRVIARHTTTGQSGRVVATTQELAFHPHSRVPGILEQFTQEIGQKQLL